MRILQRSLGGSRLVRDYLNGLEAAAAFYRGSPFHAETYRRKAEALDRTSGPAVLAAAEAIIKPAGPRAAEALRDVTGAGGYFVTTGQQPGLFGGPLYSLYKALTAVRLAEELARVVGKPVMPLFWVASEDHDWEEANHTHVVDESNQLHRLTLGPAPVIAQRPLGRIRLGDGVGEVVDELARRFPRNDFHARYVDLLRDAFRPSATLASGFANLMAELLRDTPVGLVDAGHPCLKEASRPLLRAEAEDPAASESVLAETCGALTSSGYGLQVPLIPGAANLLVDLELGRDRLQRTNGGFKLRRSGGEISRRRVLDLIDGSTHSVSPNVLMRPVVESFVFPTLAYVGGPGELAYFGQLARLFRHHGVGMPVAFPRMSLLVVEAKVAKVMEKFDVTVDELREGDGLLSRFARDRVPEVVSGAVASWRGAIESHAAELAGTSNAIDPVLAGAVTKARNSGLAALGALEKKIIRAVKRREETTWSQIAKARVHVWPDGKPQDRVLSPLQYVMRYGTGFLSLALQEIRVELVAGDPE